MASQHHINEMDSAPTDSAESMPRSDNHLHDGISAALQPRIRFMCSFGSKILPRPHDNQLRYVGGDTRIVAVYRHTTYSALLSKLSKLSGSTNISIKYQLPNEDLDSLITVTADDDIENMMEEYDRLSHGQQSARLRLFLFQTDFTMSRTSSINSLLDGSVKRKNWFFDALNGRPGSGPVLERGRSEVSSIISEVPDYLFGFDNSEDGLKESFKIKNKNIPNDTVFISRPNSPAPAISISRPISPAPVVSPPFCSTSSSLAPPVIPDLPPVKTRSVLENKEIDMMVNEKILVPQPAGYPGGGPMFHYPNPSGQPMSAVYYVPDTHVQGGNVTVQTMPIRPQFLQPYPVAQGHVQVGFRGMGQIYGAGVRPYEMPPQMFVNNATQAMYYGAGNVAVVPGAYPGGEEIQGPGKDMAPSRVSQG